MSPEEEFDKVTNKRYDQILDFLITSGIEKDLSTANAFMFLTIEALVHLKIPLDQILEATKKYHLQISMSKES